MEAVPAVSSSAEKPTQNALLVSLWLPHTITHPNKYFKAGKRCNMRAKPLESVEFREGRRFDHGNDLKLMEPARDVERFTSHPFRIR
jgi:hypothetical protein